MITPEVNESQSTKAMERDRRALQQRRRPERVRAEVVRRRGFETIM